ncbi:MAG: DUF1049 domain-containing protein [Alphaproteobacteria bacterium]|nr:MAG: DUF1049 domain-containing protein [Alphaproteobacteria bacterium]
MLQSFVTLIRRLFWLVLGVALIFFSVNNRQAVQLVFEPFSLSFPVPAFLLLFAGMFIGLVVAAGVTGWLRLQGFTRRRKAERRAETLEREVASLAEDAHTTRAGRAHDAAKSGDTAR